MIWDIFISHASEDKDEIVRPLFNALTDIGYKVWFDEQTLLLGDSLRAKIDEGLSKSSYGVVVLSPSFFDKEWPKRELDALVSEENRRGKVILPVWHNVDENYVRSFSSILASKLGVSTIQGIESIVEKIHQVLSGDGNENSKISRITTKNQMDLEFDQIIQRLRELRSTPDTNAMPFVFRCLTHNEEGIRDRAVQVLFKIGLESLTSSSVEIARGDDHKSIDEMLSGLAAVEANEQIVFVLKRLCEVLSGDFRNRAIGLNEKKRLTLELGKISELFQKFYKPVKIVRALGQGSFTSSYLARHIQTNHNRVVRVLRQDMALQEDIRVKFVETTTSSTAYNNENLVLTRDIHQFIENNVYFCVRDYIDGVDLQKFINTGKLFSNQQIFDILRQISYALKPIHLRKEIHRGIKPSNIFVTNEDKECIVVLGDISLSVLLLPVSSNKISYEYRYVAPEYFQSNKLIGIESDYYSIGCVWYELLCGHPPFVSDNPFELAKLIQEKTVVPPTDLNIEIDQKSEEFLLRLLEKDARKRPSSLAEVKTMLDYLSRNLSATHAPRETFTVAEISQAAHQDLTRINFSQDDVLDLDNTIILPGIVPSQPGHAVIHHEGPIDSDKTRVRPANIHSDAVQVQEIPARQGPIILPGLVPLQSGHAVIYNKGPIDSDKTYVQPANVCSDSGARNDNRKLTPPSFPRLGDISSTTGTASGVALRFRSSSWRKAEQWFADDGQQIEVGTVIKNRFELLELIGEGGMGMVYKALDRRKVEAQDRNPYLAIKILNEQFKKHPESLKALQREARKAQELAHPNILTVFDFDRDGATVYVTMEYMDGESLKDIIRDNSNGLPVAKAITLIEAMCHGLSYAHAKGVVHSDFKPGNVMVTRTGLIKIFDFGIARAAKTKTIGGTEGDKTSFDAASLGALTPAYASPEMFLGKDPDPRDDIFGLACISYELISGKHPYDKERADLAQKQGRHPKRLEQLNRLQWNGLSKGLNFERTSRSVSALQFLQEIKSKKSKLPLIVGATLSSVLIFSFIFNEQIRNVRNQYNINLLNDEVKNILESEKDENLTSALVKLRNVDNDSRKIFNMDEIKINLVDKYIKRARKYIDQDPKKSNYAEAISLLLEAESFYVDDIETTKELNKRIDQLKFEQARAILELESLATTTGAGGKACSSSLAGFGANASAVCYDMVTDQNKGPYMVVIPAGGGISKPFAIGKYEVSFRDYDLFCQAIGKSSPRTSEELTAPAVKVSYQNAQDYAQWLTEQTGNPYRIPKDEEWVYASEAGGKKPITDYNCFLQQGSTILKGNSLLNVNSGGANAWGLQNFIGNAQEYVDSSSGVKVRGGAYKDSMSACSISFVKNYSGAPDEFTGFRLVREIKE